MNKIMVGCLLILLVLMLAELARCNELDKIVDNAAKKYDIDPLLIKVIIETESSNNPKAIGKDGEIGLMQAMPNWYRKKGYKIEKVTPLEQIDVGVWVLKRCIDICKGDILGGLTLYHMGSKGSCNKPTKRAKYKYKKYLKRRDHEQRKPDRSNQ